MKLDYKSPFNEMGFIQRRRLFHIILGCVACLCIAFAVGLRHQKSDTPENPDIHNATETAALTLKEEGTAPLVPVVVVGEVSKDSKKETLMTLAEVKKADRNAAPHATKTTPAANQAVHVAETAEPTSVVKDAPNTNTTNEAVKKIDPPTAQDQAYQSVTIRKGDSLAKIFKRQGHSPKDLDRLLSSDRKMSQRFQALQVKQTLKIYLDENNKVQALALEGAKTKTIQLGKIPSRLIAKKDKAKETDNSIINNTKEMLNLAANTANKADANSKLEKLTKPEKSEKEEVKKTTTETTKTEATKNDQNSKNSADQKQLAFGKGTVKDSLYLSGKRAGLDKAVISQLVEIFGWSIDFSHIQPTDSFRVLFEEKRLDGEKVGSGPILAAEMTFKGKVHRAVRYTDKAGQTGYFSPEGHGLKENFLRYPLAFSHISSNFGTRNHPVIHKIRKHTGVDLAAPRGTPVKCTGDGKVVFAGTRGGYGRVIEVQHGDRYSTLYAHLSKFAPKMKAGMPVKKGQEIGNVGRTGLATGNHLHYEFRIDGVHKDPLTISLPKKNPIPDAHKRHFLAHAKEMLKLMEQHENKVNVVRNEYPLNE